MGSEFLIDTNVLIDAQSKKMPQSALDFLANIIDRDFTISFVTYIEFLGYKDATISMKEFIDMANVIEINKEIITSTIDLRKQTRIQFPDAILAATALVRDLTIVTRNTSDFKNIRGLRMVNP